MIYAWEHPESIHRSVMIAVNPPGHFPWDGPTTDEQIGRYAEHCSQDKSCSARTDGTSSIALAWQTRTRRSIWRRRWPSWRRGGIAWH